MAHRKRPNPFIKLIFAVACIILICMLFYNSDITLSLDKNIDTSFTSLEAQAPNESNFKPDNTGKFLLYVMDTGNSDSLLLITPGGQTMLVDAAEDDDFQKIKATLDKYGVTEINALIATHPHADHIGAMDDVIESVDVDVVYMTNYVDDTKVFVNLMDAVEDVGVSMIIVKSGMEFAFGDASVTVLGPQNGKYGDANNKSIVLLVSYGETDFLLTGDMEEKESREILEKWGKDVDCEILKVAHHGSATGTTKEFLDLATPDIAIISCGEDNPYGHPDEETLALLDASGAEILRTDQMGDIAILTDGTAFEALEQYAR